MKAKTNITTARSPVFYKSGVVSEGPLVYTSLSTCSGWALARGDHKSPNAHSYSRMLAYGSGRVAGINDSWYYRVLAAYPQGIEGGFSPQLYNSCIEKINGKVRGDLDLSVDAFQAKQTARQFKAGDVVTEFYKDISSWDSRHKTSNNVARALAKAIPIAKLAGALRLSWVYGWKPLVEDFYGVLDESLTTYINHYQTFNAVTRSSHSYKCAGFVNEGSPNLAPYSVLRREDCRVSVTLDTSQLPGLGRWTSLNPASIAWELLPFSFVIDWFIDVGSTLRSIETALIYNRAFKTGFVSRIIVDKGTSYGSINQNRSIGMTCSGHFAFTYVRFDRSVLKSFPMMGLPQVHPGLSNPRLLNAGALLTQFLHRK